MSRKFMILALLVSSFGATSARAACVNKFLVRTEGVKQVVTLLTGKFTFQEAQDLAKAIDQHQSAPVEWVDEKGKAIARQFGEMKIIRPMPVGCDGKTSGVVLTVTFTGRPPSKQMLVRFDANTTVSFDQQAD